MIGAALLAFQEGIPSPLRPAGDTALREAHLGWILLAIGCAVVLIITILLVIGLYRDRGEDPSQIRREGEGISWITIGGMLLPTLILLAAFGLTLEALRPHPTSAPAAVTIEVTGHRWWWEVHYIGKDPHQEALTANEVHIPVGHPVRITLKSTDVIHSFWAPELGGKTDLIPGQPNTVWLEARRPGIYRGQCAEYCGLEHARMAFVVIAEPEEEFASWFSGQQRSASPPVGLAVKGHDLFVGGPCALCHQIRGTLAGGKQGPDLTHLASRRTLAAGTLPNDRARLTAWILDPQAIKPGSLMPRLGMSNEDVAAVVEYLQTLN